MPALPFVRWIGPHMTRFCLLAAGVALLMSGVGCSMPSLLITPVSSSPELEETVVMAGQTRKAKVAIIEVEGMLLNTRASSGLLGASENKVSLFKQQLSAAAADERVKAVVLRINSPGGTVSASDTMYSMVMDFRARTGKPVVAACQDMAASGGYYVACAADEVHATPTSVIGSIGVLFETIDLTGLMDKIGVQMAPIASGPLKTMGSPFDGLTAEERQVMQSMIDEFYVRFTSVVKASRQVTDEEKAFDGRVFTGRQAYEIGLVDELCHLESSIQRARDLAGAPGARVVMYKRPYGYRGSIYASSADLSPKAHERNDLAETIGQLPVVHEMTAMLRPGFYYLWMP